MVNKWARRPNKQVAPLLKASAQMLDNSSIVASKILFTSLLYKVLLLCKHFREKSAPFCFVSTLHAMGRLQ